jgi:hypothetical protein
MKRLLLACFLLMGCASISLEHKKSILGAVQDFQDEGYCYLITTFGNIGFKVDFVYVSENDAFVLVKVSISNAKGHIMDIYETYSCDNTDCKLIDTNSENDKDIKDRIIPTQISECEGF